MFGQNASMKKGMAIAKAIADANKRKEQKSLSSTSNRTRSVSEASNDDSQKSGFMNRRRRKSSADESVNVVAAVATKASPTKVAPAKWQSKSKAEVTMELIQDTINNQEDREAELGEKVSALITEAKEKKSTGNVKGAVRAMKKVNLIRHEQNKVTSVIETLEAQMMTIESAINNAKVVAAMAAGSAAMKNLNASVTAADIDEVMDAMQQGFDFSTEINEILSQPVSNLVMDDDELLAELDGLIQKDDGNIYFPLQPSSQPVSESGDKAPGRGLLDMFS